RVGTRWIMRLLVLSISLVLGLVLTAGAEPHARPRDFRCLLKGTKPEGKSFFVFNRNRAKLRKAVAMSETGEIPPQGYPVGTILQVLPFEAMVQRRPGFNPEGDDWEFVRLGVTPKDAPKSSRTARARWPTRWAPARVATSCWRTSTTSCADSSST